MSENPTPISDALTRSKNSREGMQVLARGLDEVLQRLERLTATPAPPAADPWAEPWDDHDTHLRLQKEWRDDNAEDRAKALAAPSADAIVAVQAQLDAATDDEDRRALQARLNLLRDAAGERVYDAVSGQREAVPQGKRYQQTGDIADLVPASPERQQARWQWADKHDLHTFLPRFENDPEACRQAFAKGGPMWLYLDGREAIMQMPYEWRTWLVADIAVDSEAEAQEIGADILKHRSNANARKLATEASDRLG